MPIKRIKDKHLAFANAFAAGESATQAYLKYFNPTATYQTASTNSYKLLKDPQINELVNKIREERQQALVQKTGIEIKQKLQTPVLQNEELDAYNSAIIMGLIEIEDVYPVQTKTYNAENKLTSIVTRFERVKRQPNFSEIQKSIDMLYKRKGAYFIKKLEPAEDEGGENTRPCIILSDGSKLYMPE